MHPPRLWCITTGNLGIANSAGEANAEAQNNCCFWDIPALNGIPKEIGNTVAGLFNLGNDIASALSGKSDVPDIPLAQPSSSGENGMMMATSVAMLAVPVGDTGKAAESVSVYLKSESAYVGITKDLAAREAQHGEKLVELVGGLTRQQAKGVEQAVIEQKGLANLTNKINSIAKTNPIYQEAVQFGRQLLKSIGFQ